MQLGVARRALMNKKELQLQLNKAEYAPTQGYSSNRQQTWSINMHETCTTTQQS